MVARSHAFCWTDNCVQATRMDGTAVPALLPKEAEIQTEVNERPSLTLAEYEELMIYHVSEKHTL